MVEMFLIWENVLKLSETLNHLAEMFLGGESSKMFGILYRSEIQDGHHHSFNK